MTDVLYDWMQNLAFFFVFMTAVLNFLPDLQYRKYVGFFLGLLFMTVLCRPLLVWFDLDQIWKENVSFAMLEEEFMSSENARLSVEGMQEDLLVDAYEQEIEQQILVYLQEQGIAAKQVEVILEKDQKMRPEEIRIVLDTQKDDTAGSGGTKNEEYTKSREIREQLAQIYELDESEIRINGRVT